MVLMIVSGCLGLGKFVVLCVLEDMGFYCVDNFFVVLLFDLVWILVDCEIFVVVSIDVCNMLELLEIFE